MKQRITVKRFKLVFKEIKVKFYIKVEGKHVFYLLSQIISELLKLKDGQVGQSRCTPWLLVVVSI